MKPRPLSVTIISWFLIAASLLTFFSTAVMYNNPEVKSMMELSKVPLSLQYVLILVGTGISVLCGILMLKAKGVGRIVYVVWTSLSFIMSFFTSPDKIMLIPSVVVFLIFVFFLFMPKSNNYFSKAQGTSVSVS